MPPINDHYRKLRGAYLFPEIARRVRVFAEEQPDLAERLVNCGIGDVTEPLPQSVRDAMHEGVDELGERETFRGYGPPLGYPFLREAIAEGDFASHGLDIGPDEIYVSDGSKGDCGAILDILGCPLRVGITDPVYPVYVDSNVMVGNAGPARPDGSYEGLTYLPCTPENGFVPELPDAPLDLVYLCYPNNPVGAMIPREKLEAWVDWALEHEAIILYDVAYQAFIREMGVPRSIYEVEGARRCALELHSFSKSGGFTGVRCGYTVCPRELAGRSDDGSEIRLADLWSRRWSTKSNGVSYPVQRGAAALFSEAGRREVTALVDHYLGNAAILRKGCADLGLDLYGGINAPYVWVRCPGGASSWAIFERMLREIQVVITPGVGFGRCGEGFFRISAFNSRENVEEVVRRLSGLSLGDVTETVEAGPA